MEEEKEKEIRTDMGVKKKVEWIREKGEGV